MGTIAIILTGIIILTGVYLGVNEPKWSVKYLVMGILTLMVLVTGAETKACFSELDKLETRISRRERIFSNSSLESIEPMLAGIRLEQQEYKNQALVFLAMWVIGSLCFLLIIYTLLRKRQILPDNFVSRWTKVLFGIK
ncbi:MAG: hypothetical protein GY810_09365 [Aureispira sp.]|nr:hypothetical protein [Aureispira sp.]